jgi:hypothetical protein
MSSSESNSHDGARRRKEELELVKAFWTLVQNRLENIQRRELVSRTAGDSKFRLEDEERKILYEVNNFGLMPGAAAGLVTLFMLRRSKSLNQQPNRRIPFLPSTHSRSLSSLTL